MKHALFLTLCLSLLLDVCARRKGGGGGRSGGRTSGSSWFKSPWSSSSSSSSSKGSSSSSGGKTGPKSKSTHQSSHQTPVKDFSGRGWAGQNPTHDRDRNWGQPNTAGNRYPYWNPNNQIMSPRYAGNYAYGGYGRNYGQSGSPFAQSVNSLGYIPSDKSKGFGKQAVVAAGTGAVAGMAVGYGLGSFPRPHFHFHNSQQEYYYNYYMYQHYGSQESRNTNKRTQTYGNTGNKGINNTNSSSSGSSSDETRPPVLLKPPPQSYDFFMNTCMKRRDLLPLEPRENQSQAQNKTTFGALSTTATPPHSPHLLRRFCTERVQDPPSQEVKKDGGQESETEDKGSKMKDDPEKVDSILEIGYPALIEQLKARKCVERYVLYSQEVARKQWQEAYDHGAKQEAYDHGAKPPVMDFFSSSLLCLISFLLLY